MAQCGCVWVVSEWSGKRRMDYQEGKSVKRQMRDFVILSIKHSVLHTPKILDNWDLQITKNASTPKDHCSNVWRQQRCRKVGQLTLCCRSKSEILACSENVVFLVGAKNCVSRHPDRKLCEAHFREHNQDANHLATRTMKAEEDHF